MTESAKPSDTEEVVAEVIYVPVEKITRGTRLRKVQPEVIATLVDSIRKIGLLHPITLGPQQPDGTYELKAGLHRYLAVEQMGLPIIKATIGADNPLIEIDENLVRANPSTAEFDRLIIERKKLWEAKTGQTYPVSKKGGRGRKSFAAQTEASTLLNAT